MIASHQFSPSKPNKMSVFKRNARDGDDKKIDDEDYLARLVLCRPVILQENCHSLLHGFPRTGVLLELNLLNIAILIDIEAVRDVSWLSQKT